MQEDWFCCLKGQGHIEAHIIRYDGFYHSCWNADLFVTTFNWMVHHHKLECCVKCGFLFSRSRLQWRFKTSKNPCVSYLFCTTDFLTTKLCLLIYLLLLIIKPSTTKWAYTDSCTLTYNITSCFDHDAVSFSFTQYFPCHTGCTMQVSTNHYMPNKNHNKIRTKQNWSIF